MEKRKLVSIVIPSYHRPFILKEAILSALNQSYMDIEILVVDDNEPYSKYQQLTERIVASIYDDRIRYIKQTNHGNGAVARNTGIKNSKGHFISFLDDDDLYLKDKVKLEVEYLEKYSAYDAVYCGRFEKGQIVLPILKEDLTEEILLAKQFPCTSTLMFRREALIDLGGFNESFFRYQDLELLIRFFKKGHKIGGIQEPLVIIGLNRGENELHGEELERHKKTFIELFNKEISYAFPSKGYYYKKFFIANYVPIIFDHLSNYYFVKAFMLIIKCIRISPLCLFYYSINHIKRYLTYIHFKCINRNDKKYLNFHKNK